MADYDTQPGRDAPVDEAMTQERLDADEVDLRDGLAGVSAMVAGALGAGDTLDAVAKFAARAIPNVDGAGIALVEEHAGSGVRSTSATADFVTDIDAVQYDQFHEGPCLTAMESGRPSVSGSLGCDERWPRFGGRVARMGVHSALSLPLVVGDRVIGAINAYARRRAVFADHAVELGSLFAGPAAVAIHNARLLSDARDRTTRLQRALDSRAIIDQAIGIIRSRTGADGDEAFARLVHISQAENVKLHVVSQRLVDEAVRRARIRHQAS
ncbi:transcriptional regulator [Mycolicibacterium arabiense]|uniref:Transcriptional regulator n=1 Tax=Mycolicibacterium arabiense TaxID=1286181 RepID=A0A7I7RU58_9MYCO|nr:GAF and ANTAR domain-containing protein [Mycolicibacterium arabiense]MCV7373444.1 GAF and ANTAR domain-containing protein [Mycolicibacterium arabiense]BBY48073.1 transcriptional regulator [Mycolicibacterium arabiense]